MIETREIEMRELIEAELDRVAGGMPPQAPGKETPPPPPRDPHPIYPF
jgi:hypothetical protein